MRSMIRLLLVVALVLNTISCFPLAKRSFQIHQDILDELEKSINEVSSDYLKRDYILTDLEKEFLNGWTEEKRVALKRAVDEVQAYSALTEPLSPGERAIDQVASFDEEINPLVIGEQDSNQNGKRFFTDLEEEFLNGWTEDKRKEKRVLYDLKNFI